jgi:hypothetical protein
MGKENNRKKARGAQKLTAKGREDRTTANGHELRRIETAPWRVVSILSYDVGLGWMKEDGKAAAAAQAKYL